MLGPYQQSLTWTYRADKERPGATLQLQKTVLRGRRGKMLNLESQKRCTPSTTRKRRNKLGLLALSAAATSAAATLNPGSAIGANASWTKTAGGTFEWTDAANWSAAFPNGSTNNQATIGTDLTGDEIINLSQNIQVSAFNTFGDSTATSGVFNNFTIQGNGSFSLTIPTTGIISQNGNNTISAAIILNGASAIFQHNNNTGAAGSLTISGGITGTNAAVTLNGNGSVFITNGMSVGTGALTKSGTGTATVSGNSTFGNISVSAGTLVLAGNNTMGNTSITGGTVKVTDPGGLGVAGKFVTLTAAGGGVLQYASNSAINTQNITIAAAAGNSTIILDRATNGSAVDQSFGTIALGGSSTAFSGLYFNTGAGVTSGTPTATIGTLVGSGTGRTTHLLGTANLSIGSLTSTGASTMAFALDTTSANNFITGNITNGTATSVSVSINNGGTWTFSGLSGNNTYTGTTTIGNGTLKVGANNTLSTGSALTIAGNVPGAVATLDLNGFAQTLPAFTMGGGNVTGAAQVIGAGTTSNLTLSGGATAVTYTATGNALGALISTTNIISSGGNITFVVGDSSNAANDLTVSSNITNGNVSKTGAGTLWLSGNSGYTGGTTITNGVLAVSTLGNVGFNSSVGTGNVSLSATAAILRYVGAGETSNKGIIGTGGSSVNLTIEASGTGDLKLTSDITFTTAGVARDVNLQGNANGEMAGRITDTGAGVTTVRKLGTGTWIYSGNNTYSGSTIIGTTGLLDGGTLQIIGAGKIGTGSVLIRGSGTLDITNTSQSLGSVTFGDGGANSVSTLLVGTGGNLSFSSAGATITYNGDTLGASGSFISGNGVLSMNSSSRVFAIFDSGNATSDLTVGISLIDGGISSSLTKTRNGTLLLTAANTYTGTTTVGSTSTGQGGALRLSGNGTISNNAVTVYGGTLGIDGMTQAITSLTMGSAHVTGNTAAFSSAVTIGSGNLTVTGGITYNTSQSSLAATISGVGGGVLSLNNTTQTVNVDKGNDAIDLTISAIIPNGGITKGGVGVLALTANNTFANGVNFSSSTVNNGNIAIGHDNALGTGNFTMSGTGGIRSVDATDHTIANVLGTFAGTTATYTFGDLAGVGTGALTFSSTGTTALGAAGRTFAVHNTTTFAGGFSGSAATTINKTGNGTMVINGATTYTGNTTISNGKLVVNNTFASGNVSVAAGATLGGNGTLAGKVITNGNTSIISPGNSPGDLTIGSLDATTGARMKFEVGSTDASTVSDHLIITGLFAAPTSGTGGLIMDIGAWGFDPAGPKTGVTYTLVTFGSAPDLQDTDLTAGLGTSLVLDTTFGATDNGNGFGFGNDNFFVDSGSIQIRFSAVPEPTSLSVLGLGVGGLLARRRRRRVANVS